MASSYTVLFRTFLTIFAPALGNLDETGCDTTMIIAGKYKHEPRPTLQLPSFVYSLGDMAKLEEVLVPATHQPKRLFSGCLNVRSETEDLQTLNAIINIIEKSRIHILLILTTTALSDTLQEYMVQKPRFDAVVLSGKNNSSLPFKQTRFNSRQSPGWLQLRVNFFHIKPFFSASSDNEKMTYSGIDHDTWRLLASHLGVEYKYSRVQRHDSLATNLLDGKSDVSVSQPAFTYSRHNLGVRFSQLLTQDRVHFATKPPGPVDKFYTMTYPFTARVWLSLGISVVMVMIFLLVNNGCLRLRFSPYVMFSVATTALITESLPEIYLSNRRRSRSAFVAMFMWLFVGSLVAHIYKSDLLASLVAVGYEKPIDTWQQMLENNMILTVLKGNSLEDLMSTSPVSAVREVHAQTLARGGFYLSESWREPPPHIVDMRESGEGAWVTTPVYSAGSRHTLRLSREHLPPTHNGFYFAVKLPFQAEIDWALGQIVDTGVFEGIRQKHLFRMARPERDHRRLASAAATGISRGRRPLEPRHVAAMVVLHGIGLGMAVAAFVLEWAAKMPPLR